MSVMNWAQVVKSAPHTETDANEAVPNAEHSLANFRDALIELALRSLIRRAQIGHQEREESLLDTAACNATVVLLRSVFVIVHPKVPDISIAPDGYGGVSVMIQSPSGNRGLSVSLEPDGSINRGATYEGTTRTVFVASGQELATRLKWLHGA